MPLIYGWFQVLRRCDIANLLTYISYHLKCLGLVSFWLSNFVALVAVPELQSLRKSRTVKAHHGVVIELVRQLVLGSSEVRVDLTLKLKVQNDGWIVAAAGQQLPQFCSGRLCGRFSSPPRKYVD